MQTKNRMIEFSKVKSNKLSITLWILQLLLAALFLWHGWLLVTPPAELVDIINANIGYQFSKFIGIAEILAAVGLILPGLMRMMPSLTVLSAAGLAIVMISATVYHFFRGEFVSGVQAAIIFLVVTFVAYMRWKIRPVLPRARDTSQN